MAPFLDYDLPSGLIAQEPCQPRDRARLLLAQRSDQALSHHHFYDLPDLLQHGDLLVLNDTKVLPARLLGRRARSGGKWEGLYLQTLADGTWEIVCQTRGRLQPGEMILVDPGPLTLELTAALPQGRWQARPNDTGPAAAVLERFGQTPLPPYIRRGASQREDRQRYQTVFAQKTGAVAAPTAGLHFTPEIFHRLDQRGIAWTFVTLHIGLGTFRPLGGGDYTARRLPPEWGQQSAATGAALDACRRRGGRVVAVGTTTVRVLETACQSKPPGSWSGPTDLFIYPPYSFQVVDALLTNFHLPRTTLLLLVNAFAGPELVKKVYQTAMTETYRFYSYGDTMLIV